MNKTSPLKYEATHQHVGLNNQGENNCFLNVTIQALWHLGPFRIELQKITNELEKNYKSVKDEDVDIMSILCNLFTQYEFTDLNVLPPTELRVALNTISDRFHIGIIFYSNYHKFFLFFLF
jgi:ubiquitin C-terminal hydrolase